MKPTLSRIYDYQVMPTELGVRLYLEGNPFSAMLLCSRTPEKSTEWRRENCTVCSYQAFSRRNESDEWYDVLTTMHNESLHRNIEQRKRGERGNQYSARTMELILANFVDGWTSDASSTRPSSKFASGCGTKKPPHLPCGNRALEYWNDHRRAAHRQP